MAKKQDLPVYLFTGFLEAGKTRFIQETLEDKRFCKGEKTLLLLCEEGEEEYAPDEFVTNTVTIRVLEDMSQLTPEHLQALADETDAERVIVEYNGMWMLDNLYTALPEGWMVYQEFLFCDARTILQYNGNMRQLVYDKLKSCELVVFNRFAPGMDKTEYHKLVRGASRRAEIAYEYADGKVEYDDLEDPLPFDLDAPIVEIGDEDYAVWYRDLSEEPKKYEGKKVRFKCRCLVRKKLPSETFVAGRHVMTCCVEDIQFAGLVCQWKHAGAIQDDSWMILTAEVHFKFSVAYGKRGPVLSYLTSEPCDPPENPVATFY